MRVVIMVLFPIQLVKCFIPTLVHLQCGQGIQHEEANNALAVPDITIEPKQKFLFFPIQQRIM
jgi:hypothetical protein